MDIRRYEAYTTSGSRGADLGPATQMSTMALLAGDTEGRLESPAESPRPAGPNVTVQTHSEPLPNRNGDGEHSNGVPSAFTDRNPTLHGSVGLINVFRANAKLSEAETEALGAVQNDPEVAEMPYKPIKFFINMHRMGLDSVEAAWHKVVARAHLLKSAAPGWWFHQKQAIRDAIVPSGPNAEYIGTVFNMSNCILGAGILSLPLAFAWTGWAVMLPLVIIMGWLNKMTAQWMVEVAYYEQQQAFGDCTQATLGTWPTRVSQWLLIIGQFGALIAYVVLIGDFIETVGDAYVHGGVNRRLITTIACLVIVLPLSLKRSMNDFRVISFLSVMFVCFYVVSVVIKVSQHGKADGVVAGRFGTDFFRALPAIIFAFAMQTSVLPIFRSMKEPTPEKFSSVATGSIFLCGTFYALSGLCAYIVVGKSVEGNILNNFAKDHLMTVVTLCFLFTIMFVFPVQNFALRISLHFSLFGPTTVTNLQHYCETFFPFIIALVIGLFINDVSIVFSFAGSLSSALLAFVFPAWMYLKSKKVPKPRHADLHAWIVIVFGVLACALGLGSAIWSLDE